MSVRAALYLNNLASAQEDDAKAGGRRAPLSPFHRNPQESTCNAMIPRRCAPKATWAASLVRARKYAEAQAYCNSVVQLRVRALPADHGDLIDTRLAILESEVRLEQRDRAMATWMALAPMETKLTGARKLISCARRRRIERRSATRWALKVCSSCAGTRKPP